MSDWQEAETGQQSEPSLTTDDLVFMIGELVIKERHTGKISVYQQQKIQALENEILKSKSLSVGTNTKLEELVIENNNLKAEAVRLKTNLETETVKFKANLEAETVKFKANLETIQNERHPRIIQLEEQVHNIALERDEARRNERIIFDRFEELKASIKPKRRVK